MRSDKLNITKYTVLAAAFLHPENVLAEVIYTDIEPDIVISNPGQILLLDLNNNGTADFNFLFSTTNFAYFTYYGAINFYQLNAILALPQNGNSIAAFTVGGGAYVYPYVIEDGIDIGPITGNFSDKSVQTMAYQFYAIIQSYFYYPLYIAGDWVFGETKKYIGLALHDNDSTYYGWLRLDVASNNRSFTARDYAFETIADKPISTFTPVPVDDIEPELNAAIHAFDKIVHIELNITPPDQAVAKIIDINGKLITAQNIETGANQIDLKNFASGYYIVTLQVGQQQLSKKIFI